MRVLFGLAREIDPVRGRKVTLFWSAANASDYNDGLQRPGGQLWETRGAKFALKGDRRPLKGNFPIAVRSLVLGLIHFHTTFVRYVRKIIRSSLSHLTCVRVQRSVSPPKYGGVPQNHLSVRTSRNGFRKAITTKERMGNE